MIRSATLALIAIPAAFAQTIVVWGQCGGIGYTGSTTCASGSYCYAQNAYYSQLGSGDSYSQSGFDITGTKPSSSNPIGNPTFPGYTSSGGLNWLEYLITQYNSTLAYNYNFASGGAGINTTIVSTYGTPLTTQVSTFLTNLGSKPSYAPWASADSLFVLWIGINDIGNSWYLGVDQSALHTQMIDTVISLWEQLYAVGARKFLFLSIPPVEKTPLMLLQSESDRTSEAAQIADFNSKLFSRSTTWSQGKSGTTIYQFDTQVPFNQIIASPTTYGYTDATTSCQTSACMWWDTYHPSAGVHKVVAQQVSTLLTGFL